MLIKVFTVILWIPVVHYRVHEIQLRSLFWVERLQSALTHPASF